ncbi:MAG: hypothetical protein OSB00_05670 [Sphingomonas bacterium]|nr:hypothetical protein [Sphingomonas bacterium]
MASVDGPLAGVGDTTRMSYDAARQLTQVTGPDPDGAGARKSAAVVVAARNNDGKPTDVRRGSANADGSGFSAYESVTTAYDGRGRKIADRLLSAGQTYSATDYSY